MSSLAGRILVVQPQGVAGRIVDQLEVGMAELAVRARIAEAPGELLGGHFDGDGIGRRFIEMHAGPDLGAHDHQADEQQRRGAGPQGFELVVAVRIPGAAAIVAELDDDPAEGELRQDEDDPDHHQGAHELRVIGHAVRPKSAEETTTSWPRKNTNNYRQDPNYGSKQHPGLPLPLGPIPLCWAHGGKTLPHPIREVQLVFWSLSGL